MVDFALIQIAFKDPVIGIHFDFMLITNEMLSLLSMKDLVGNQIDISLKDRVSYATSKILKLLSNSQLGPTQ